MLKPKIQLIAYPNRMGDNLADLYQVMHTRFSGAFGGVHILPLYPSNADGGFSPLTHKEVDPAFGDWNDIETIARDYDLCLDITLNHISDESEEFKDFEQHGFKSKHADLFVNVPDMGEIGPDDLAKIHIRKEKEPFRDVQFADGTATRVWCTFTEHQIDLNYRSEKTYAMMEDTIKFLTERGVKLFRLDAFGYTTKKIGTSCFLVEPKVYDILQWFHERANENGAEVLPEVHDHYSYQMAIGDRGMRPYGFALPPLVLYSILDANSTYLKNWLRHCPEGQLTVLDTHDGICIPDVEGLLPSDKIQAMIDNVQDRSADPILRGSAANVHSVGAIYQLTCTFYDALKRNDDAYICARAIQFFAPGIPQVYYVGALAGVNDDALMSKTGELRDINRQYYSIEDVDKEMERPVVQRLLKLMRFRNSHPAFEGKFELHYSNQTSVAMAWRNGEAYCELFVDLNFKKASIRYWDTRSGMKMDYRP
ncbi:sucrose phosphorylase [bacterium]|nr:sucrose phosphorylase [bacterium]